MSDLSHDDWHALDDALGDVPPAVHAAVMTEVRRIRSTALDAGFATGYARGWKARLSAQGGTFHAHLNAALARWRQP